MKNLLYFFSDECIWRLTLSKLDFLTAFTEIPSMKIYQAVVYIMD